MIIAMFEPFIIFAWLAGVGISLMSAPLGCFIAWQRLAYFGDTVAHAALLGVVLSLLSGTPILLGLILIALLVAVIASQMHEHFALHTDSVLGISAHASLALALVILSLSDITIEIKGLLFGDILAVSSTDLLTIYSAAIAVMIALITRWKPLLRFVIHADIAKVERQNTQATKLLLMTLIALTVAISIKLVGILLITSLLIIPAAAARFLSKTPQQMIVLAIATSILAVTFGLIASLQFDTPTGPSIILAALALLCISTASYKMLR
jgi:zinc transport system permease protein